MSRDARWQADMEVSAGAKPPMNGQGGLPLPNSGERQAEREKEIRKLIERLTEWADQVIKSLDWKPGTEVVDEESGYKLKASDLEISLIAPSGKLRLLAWLKPGAGWQLIHGRRTRVEELVRGASHLATPMRANGSEPEPEDDTLEWLDRVAATKPGEPIPANAPVVTTDELVEGATRLQRFVTKDREKPASTSSASEPEVVRWLGMEVWPVGELDYEDKPKAKTRGWCPPLARELLRAIDCAIDELRAGQPLFYWRELVGGYRLHSSPAILTLWPPRRGYWMTVGCRVKGLDWRVVPGYEQIVLYELMPEIEEQSIKRCWGADWCPPIAPEPGKVQDEPEKRKAAPVADLVGYMTLTPIIVPKTGRMIALRSEILTAERAEEIEGMTSVMAELRYSRQPGAVFQITQAYDHVDAEGKIWKAGQVQVYSFDDKGKLIVRDEAQVVLSAVTRLEARRESAAQSDEADEIKTLRLRLLYMLEMGSLIELKISGLSLLSTRALTQELGIGDGDARLRHLGISEIFLVPKKWVGQLRSKEVSIRRNLAECAFDLPGFAPLKWMPESVSKVWLARHERLCGEIEAIKGEMIGEWLAIIEEMKGAFGEVAEAAWKALWTNGHDVVEVVGREWKNDEREQYVEMVVERLLAAMPTPKQIEGINVEYEVGSADPLGEWLSQVRAKVLESVEALLGQAEKNGRLVGRSVSKAEGLAKECRELSAGLDRELIAALGEVGASVRRKVDGKQDVNAIIAALRRADEVCRGAVNGLVEQVERQEVET